METKSPIDIFNKPISRAETILNESIMVEHDFHRQMLHIFPDFCDQYDVRMIDRYLPRVLEHLSRVHTVVDIGSGTSKLALELEKFDIRCISIEACMKTLIAYPR